MSWNFCAGPSALPKVVLQQVREQLLDWDGRGMSLLEMSHRSDPVQQVTTEAEADLRALMNIDDDYAVLFLQGGATYQFAMVPLNLAPAGASTDYLVSGTWSEKAVKEARCLGEVNVVSSNVEAGYRSLAEQSQWACNADASYFHYTPNETIVGVELREIPEVVPPLVADMSSMILSRPVDVSRFGLIYAGAQKNMGPSGLCVVIVRKDLLREDERVPAILSYAAHAKAGSMLNTPPVFSIYMAGLIYKWLLQQGGLDKIAEQTSAKAELLYNYLDASEFYHNPVDAHLHSRTNIPFLLADDALNKEFLHAAEGEKLYHLQGHRSVGGMRASLYNATPLEAVQDLVQFMDGFAQRHGN